MWRKSFKTVVLCFALFFGLSASVAIAGDDVIQLAPQAGRIVLPSEVEMLEDAEGKLTIDEVLKDSTSQRFALGTHKGSYSPSAFWFRYNVHNTAASAATWWLEVDDRRWVELDLYVPDGAGQYKGKSARITMPFAERPLPSANYLLPLTVPANATNTVYLRVRSHGFTARTLSLRLWQPEVFLRNETESKIQWFAYLGVAGVLALLNLLLFASTRDRHYAYYVLSVVSIAWMITSQSGGTGFAFEYFWPGSPRFEWVSYTLGILAPTVFVTLFISKFVDIPRFAPRAFRIGKVIYFAICIGFGLRATGIWFGSPVPLAVMQKFYAVTSLSVPLFAIAMLLVVGRLAWTGNLAARIVVLAWTPMFILVAVSTLGAVAGVLALRGAFTWGSAFELLVMSWALADRFKRETQARELAQSAQAAAQAALITQMENSERELEEKVIQRTSELAVAEAQAKDLLHNILPVELVKELTETGTTRPVRHESVSILFTDFSGFTQAASTMPADQMVGELNDIFAAFDDICDECGVEKIKTIGDAYMAAAGVPRHCPDHALRAVRAGLRMVEFLEQRNLMASFKWQLRVGIHTGSVVSGVVGKRKYAFDIWGDTVNIASRMESSGAHGRVNISAYTHHLVRDSYACEYRGRVQAKGKGEIDMYFVQGAISAPGQST